MLSAETLSVITATAPAVAANLPAIVSKFYPRMFENAPEVLQFFNISNQREKRQPHALADAVLAAVAHLTDLAPLAAAFELIAHKHCALGVMPEHYKIVHDNFLGATAEVLGDAVTAEVAAAWSAVLLHLAGALIELEKSVYRCALERPGGWSGPKPFKITKIVTEGPGVKSFYLAPADGSKPPQWTPGQFLTLCENPTPSEYFAPRHYTISSPTELRITSRLERRAGHPDGIMSSFLHRAKEGDQLRFRPPFGIFTRKGVPGDGPEIYISGGIGITPLAAMAQEACKSTSSPIAFCHIGEISPLYAETEAQISASANPASFSIACRRPMAPRLAIMLLSAGLDLQRATVFISGPRELMSVAAQSLVTAGVPKANIRFESFGPKQDLFGEQMGKCPMSA